MPPRRISPLRSAPPRPLALVPLALVAAAACRDLTGGSDRALAIATQTAAVECLAGQTVSVGLTVTGGQGTPAVSFAATNANVSVGGEGGPTSLAIVCVSPGASAVTITATSGERSVVATLPVTVSPAPRLEVTLQPTAVTCMAGDTVALSIGVAGGIGTPTLAVASSRPAVATVGGVRGGAATVSCATPGSASVAVTATSGAQTVTDSVAVVVTPVVPLEVSLEPARLTCVLGESVVVQARIAGSRSGRPTVSFSTADARIRVAPSGASAVVHCTEPGSATVTVTAVDGRQEGRATLPVAVTLRPQTVVLFATPKFIPDFDNPGPAVDRFLAHYEPLTSRAAETIVIFAVGNTEHILTYRGTAAWSDSLKWARYTDGKLPGERRPMYYTQVAQIVRAFKERAAARGVRLKVYDQVDPGNEFVFEVWKYDLHPECMDKTWDSFDIRGRLKADNRVYASSPQGTPAGLSCGTFLVNQVGEYLRDFGFDGILYGNQFGTRGRWLPNNGPGYTDAEAAAIREFLAYSRQVYGSRGLMWFDSYNNTRVERDTYSFPPDGYQYFDHIMASGFAVVTEPPRYLDNLRSKLAIPNRPRVLATLDYVDPWYSYNSMTDYPAESAQLEAIAIEHRDRVDGVVFFANDDDGSLVPRSIIESFAARYFGPR